MITRLMAVLAISIFILSGCGKAPDPAVEAKTAAAKKSAQDEETAAKAEIKKMEKEKEKAKSAQEGQYEKPVFKLKNWDKDVKKPEVEDDSSNVSVEKVDSAEKDDKEIPAPAGTLAAKLASSTEKIMWTPKWYFEGVGGVKLPGICLSPDSSVVAIVETTGTDKGPNGSRIVLMSTYNWQVLKIHDFQENKLTKICFLPDGNEMAAWSEKQNIIKKPYELLLIGTAKGEIKSASKEIRSDASDIAAVKGFVLAKGVEDNDICCFDSADLSKSPKKIKSQNKQGVFAVSADRVAFAGEKYLEIYDAAGMELLKKTETGGNFIPDNAIFAGSNDVVAVSAYNKPGILFKEGQKKEFCDMVGHSIAFNKEDKLLIFEKYLNNEICLLDLPDLAEYGKFTPSGINPKTHGTAIFIAYLKHIEKYAIIDSYGNLSLYSKYKKSVKWYKKVVLSTKK